MLLLDDDDQLPNSPCDPESRLSASLGPAGLQGVDEALLVAARPRWLKVSRVVIDAIKGGGFSMDEERVYVRRTIGLASAGKLEAQGNLHRPRFSEVRLPAALREAQHTAAPDCTGRARCSCDSHVQPDERQMLGS